MRSPRSRQLLKESVELNITAFLNLMVILVPFLLITAVFSRLTVLELNLPPLGAEPVEDEKIELSLALVIRETGMAVEDANLGVIKHVPQNAQGYDWETLKDSLVEIKARFPETQDIQILMERQVPYKVMIKAMDAVRSAQVVQSASLETVELFPNISIGDAPSLSADDAGDDAPATGGGA